jgi:type II secretory ATPase GspE/PulE/Tfp pilus assembly ATPase PilB-like protein
MNIETLLGQQAATAFLVSWWKMLLMLPPFFGWAWLISTKLDKDARYFHLNHRMWNSIHLGAGAAALAAMLFIPIFWLSWPVGVIILLGPILTYWHIRNNAVPEEQKYYLSSEGLGAKLTARAQARASKQALIQFTDAKGQDRKVPLKDDPLFTVHMLAEDMFGPATVARVSRIDLLVGQNGGMIRQTIDGIQYKRETIPTDASLRLMDYLKDIAGLDVSDRRRRQSGQFKLRGPSGTTEINMVTAGSSSGQTVRLDFDRANRLHKPFDGLGLLAPQLEALRTFEQPHERHGIILIGAPAGHGLTTTTYSLISRHDAYTSNVKTLEREISLALMGVDQVQFDPSNPDIDYATNLQSILRRDPDIVLTAELTDTESAKVAADPGMKGPLIYIQQSLPTIADQIRDWVKKVGDLKEASRALRAVMNQRLLRSLCPNCRQAYQPTPEQIKKLNLPAAKVKQLHRASGKVQVKNKIEDCPVCGGTGYLGQTAAFEVLIVNDEIRKDLSTGDLKSALAHARRNNMFYIQEAALSKVVSGETDLDEVVRVTSPAKSSSSGGGGHAPKVADGSGSPNAPKPTPVA